MPESSSDSPADRLLISLCTYNERENIELLVPAIFAEVPSANVLIVDDNSPDGTGEFADELAAADARVRVVHRPGKQGLGTATLAALRYAIEQGYDYWLNMDADFSHHPRHLPAMVAGCGRVDVMIGSRYVPGGGVIGWPFRRHLMSRTINLYARLTLGLKTRDNSGSYRCYDLTRLRQLDLDRFRATGYAVQEELLYRCQRVGCSFEESPITFEDRRYGESKINKREAVLAVWVMARLLGDRLLGASVQKPDDSVTNSPSGLPASHEPH